MVWNKIRSNNQNNSKIDAVTIQTTGHLPPTSSSPPHHPTNMGTLRVKCPSHKHNTVPRLTLELAVLHRRASVLTQL